MEHAGITTMTYACGGIRRGNAVLAVRVFPLEQADGTRAHTRLGGFRRTYRVRLRRQEWRVRDHVRQWRPHCGVLRLPGVACSRRTAAMQTANRRKQSRRGRPCRSVVSCVPLRCDPLRLRDQLTRDRKHRHQRLLERHFDPAAPVSTRGDKLVDQLLEL